MSDPLILPRRLAIALLAEAQRADGAPVQGVIAARDNVPTSLQPNATAAREPYSTWAVYRSGSGEPDTSPVRQVLVSIDTKGVLQLRCFERNAKAAVEREIRII